MTALWNFGALNIGEQHYSGYADGVPGSPPCTYHGPGCTTDHLVGVEDC